MQTKIIQKITTSASQTETVGASFATWIEENIPTGAIFIAMSGNLGAGKTTFVRGMASVLAPDAHVSSPTYAIVNCYSGKRELYHCDLYRISDEDDLVSVGFYDFVQKGIVIAEWAEVMERFPTEEYFTVAIDAIDENRREITICRHRNKDVF